MAGPHMRVSREKATETRERILDAASGLFRAKGFGGIGVADIMKAADLTHGGFYGHFSSKDDLVSEASRRSMARAATNWARIVADAPDKPYAALLAHYLSPQSSRRAGQRLRVRCARDRRGARRQRRAQGLCGRLTAAPRYSRQRTSGILQGRTAAEGSCGHGGPRRRADTGARGRR